MQLRSFSVITCQKWPILSYIQQIGLLIQKIFTVPCKSSSARYLTGDLFKIAEMLLSYLTWKTHKKSYLILERNKTDQTTDRYTRETTNNSSTLLLTQDSYPVKWKGCLSYVLGSEISLFVFF